MNVYIAALMAGVPGGDLATYSAVNKPAVREFLKKLRMNSGPFLKRRILWPTLSEKAWNGFARMWKNAGK